MKAVILLNMGGARNKKELSLFLKNMFNDKNIITMKSKIFRSLLASFIVSRRLDESWKNYEKIGGCSPIYEFSDKLKKKLQSKLGKEYYVTYAMRYTPPFAKDVLLELEEKKIKDVIFLPLYPHYSTTTTKSSLEDFDGLFDSSYSQKTIEPFYKDEKYNQVIIDEIKKNLNNQSDYNIIFSAHALPQKIIKNGDPYQSHIQEEVKILQKMLDKQNIKYKSVSLAYQSKLGPIKWLEPSLGTRLKELKKQKVIIYPISFIIDNSETKFELSVEYKEVAEECEIKDYIVCACPNDKDDFVAKLIDLLKN